MGDATDNYEGLQACNIRGSMAELIRNTTELMILVRFTVPFDETGQHGRVVHSVPDSYRKRSSR